MSTQTQSSVGHCSYEWSIKQDNVFEHDTLICCYETSEIMSTVDTFSELIVHLMNAEDDALVNIKDIVWHAAGFCYKPMSAKK